LIPSAGTKHTKRKTMKNIWIISDTHFNHENIIKYCNRPFANAKEMNEALVENWNSVVKDDDIIYHLGDVYFGRDSSWSSKLNGRKRLIIGNHDNVKNVVLTKMFEKIMIWRAFPEFGLFLSHMAVHPSAFELKACRNLHGHTHDVDVSDEKITLDNETFSKYYNVCVEKTGYKPINIEELRIK